MSDHRFETSFIPQQPLIEPERRSFGREVVNPALIIALIIFFTTITVAGGVYYFKIETNKEVVAASERLKALESEIRPDLISPYKAMAARLAVARGLVDNHRAFSIILDLLEESISRDVGLVELNYVEDKLNKTLLLTLEGEAANYSAAYLQLEKWRSMAPAVRSVSVDPVSLDEFTGIVNFGATLTIDPTTTRYAHIVEKMSSQKKEDTSTLTPDALPLATSTSQTVDSPNTTSQTEMSQTFPKTQ